MNGENDQARGAGEVSAQTPEFPLCVCGEFYASHHPECPALRAYQGQKASLDRLRALNAELLAAVERDEIYPDCPACADLRALIARAKGETT